MRRSIKKQKKTSLYSPQQKDAIKYLSLISQKQTGYLQDWTRINQIREQDIQSSKQLPGQQSNPVRLGDTVKSKFNNIKQHQQSQNPQNKRKTRYNIKKSVSSRKNILTLEYSEQTKNSFPNIQPNTYNTPEKSIEKNQQILILSETRAKKPIQVYVQDFASVPYRRNNTYISKANLQQLRKYQNEEIQSVQQKQKKEKLRLKKNEQSSKKNRSISSSIDYIQKIRILSLPWLKNLPKMQKQKKLQLDIQRQMKDREQARRINELIRNKIRRKQSNKFLIQKKLNQVNKTQNQNKNSDTYQQKQRDSLQKEPSQLKLLKSWLDNNRTKKKRSISSLLTEHFQNKYLEMKKHRQKTMAQKSTKLIAAISQYQRRFC